jgi:uncharacterized small protein (TIGR04563 family)
MASPGTKRSIFIDVDLLRLIEAEAQRLDRSVSWVVQRSCEVALDEIRRLPSRPERTP